ncbi:MAG: hypothetical protein M1831_001304 [Alyxoria varia]|nr:MAG: hypothetical protein M1831_001304 [Alyxoria varia]
MPSLSFVSLATWCLSSAIPFVSASDLGSYSQTLRPVRKNPSLRRRHIDFTPRLDGHELHYTDYNTADSLQDPLVAKVSLEPRLPTIVLDDLSSQLHAVTCKRDSLTVEFGNLEPMLDAERAWSKDPEFLMIVTPSLCGGDWDEHASYMVSNISWDDEDLTAILLAQETTLKKATKSMTVSLGRSMLSSIDKRDVERSFSPKQLRKRSAQGEPDDGDASPAPTSVSANLAINQVSKTILPPTGTNSAAYSRAADLGAPIPTNVIIQCLNCTSRGNVALSGGGFTVNNEEGDDEDILPDDVFQSGFLEFTASDFSGLFKLGIDFLPGAKAEVTIGRIPGLRLPRLRIGRSLTIGPEIQYGFPVSITTENPVNITTGFTLDVPNDSSIRVDLGNPTNSKATGFPQASLKPLDFDINAPHPNFTLTAGFQPGIALTANPGRRGSNSNSKSNSGSRSGANSNSISGSAGITLDLPELSAEVTEIHNKNAQCENPPPGPVYADLISVKPSAAVRGNVQIPGKGERTLFEVERDLPGFCYVFDEGSGGLVKPGGGGGKGRGPGQGVKEGPDNGGSSASAGASNYGAPPPPAPVQTGTTSPAAYPSGQGSSIPTPSGYANGGGGNSTVPGTATGTGLPVEYTGAASADGKNGSLMGWSIAVGFAAAVAAVGL